MPQPMPFPSLVLDGYDRDGVWPPDPLTAAARYHGVTLRRVLAYLADVAIIALLSFLLHLVLGIASLMTFGLLGFLHLLAPPLLIALAYHPLMMAGPLGGTIGMRLFDLRVYSILRGPLPLLQAFIHTLCFYGTLGFGCGLLLLIGLFNPRRRTLHDFLAGAVVLRRMEKQGR